MEERMEKRGEQLVQVVEEEEDDVLLPGFRFCPTDEELVGFYLRRKVDKKPLSIEIIREIEIYKYDPWDLPKVITAGEQECFFFCLRGRKYRNSIRPNRVTGSGFWKATGIDKPIYSGGSKSSGDCIGLKKSLVYYRGSAGKGVKTEWMMHEYRLASCCTKKNNTDNNSSSPTLPLEAEIWTICRILKRSITYKKQANSWNKASSNNELPLVRSLIPADHESSPVTGSFEVSSGYSNGETMEPPVNNIYYHQEINNTNNNNNQECAGQYWNSIANDPLMFCSTDSTITSQSPCMDEFFSTVSCDGNNWDELGRIMDFMTDLSSDPYMMG